MIGNKSIHRVLDDPAQLQFIRLAHVFQHVTEDIGYTTGEVDGQCPAFTVFEDMMKEKVIKPVFDDILDHEMPAVLV